jgi:hypothetical protein
MPLVPLYFYLLRSLNMSHLNDRRLSADKRLTGTSPLLSAAQRAFAQAIGLALAKEWASTQRFDPETLPTNSRGTGGRKRAKSDRNSHES